MDYRRFVELRQASCATFEAALERARQAPRQLSYEDLERLTLLYRQALHDHALAATRFPGTAITRRLRHLVLQGTHFLQRDTGDRLPSLKRFFGHSLPQAFARILPRLGWMALLFSATTLLGFCLTVVQPSLGIAFLSPEAVDGLRQGRLWTESIFAAMPGAAASSMIATNNLSVAITAWAGGALAGLGALYIVFINGLMLGSVIALAAQYSMADPLFEFIAAHGPLELSLILVSAGAGLEIGLALIQPGDRPRGIALRDAGRTALIVLLGCLPWFVVLGLVEGFLSPSTTLPLAIKVALGLLLEALFLALAFNRPAESAAR